MEQESEGEPAADAAIDLGAEAEKPWFSRRRSIRYRAVDVLSRWSDGRIRSPHYRGTEAFYRSKDAEENLESRLTEGQRIDTPGLWATEAYTPASAAILLRSLNKLTRNYNGLGDRDPADWVRRQRHRPGSSYHLYLVRPGKGRIPSTFEVELPAFAAAATATIWSATASLTMITVAFELNDHARGRINDILARDQPTRLERSGKRGMSIFTPELERRRLVGDVRSKWIAETSTWFQSNFPGLFSSSGVDVPTCELSVVTGIRPFPDWNDDRGSRRDQEILHALRASHANVFVPSDEADPGIFYAPFPDSDERRSRHAIVAMTRDGYDGIEADGWGDDEASRFWAFDQSFRTVVAQWHIARVLGLFNDRVASVRDRFAELIGGSKAASALAKVRRDTADCADAATIAREVERGVDDASLAIYGAGFVLRADSADGDRRTAVTALREALRFSSRRLAVDLTELNSSLHAQAALLSAHANLRLQPAIIFLAVVSTIAGGIAAIEPVEKLFAHVPVTAVVRSKAGPG